MSEQAEQVGTGGVESLVFDSAELKFKSVKGIPDTAHVIKRDRVEARVVGNVVTYEFGPRNEKVGAKTHERDVLVRVIEIDAVTDVKVIGRQTSVLPDEEDPAIEGQERLEADDSEGE